VPGEDWPAEPTAPRPAFDRAALLERLGGDETILVEIVRVFLEDAPGQYQAMQAAAAAGDVPVLRRLAHTLKGSAGTVGATRLQDAALVLEKAVVRGDMTEAARLIPALGEHLAEVERTMSEWLGGEKRA
jgi:two-component system, sensor histidine kinase and response regulator